MNIPPDDPLPFHNRIADLLDLLDPIVALSPLSSAFVRNLLEFLQHNFWQWARTHPPEEGVMRARVLHVFGTLSRLQFIQESIFGNLNQAREYGSEDAVTTIENAVPQYSVVLQALIAAVSDLLTVPPQDDTLDGNRITSDGSGNLTGGLGGGEAMAQSGAVSSDTESHPPQSNTLGPSSSAHNVTTVTSAAVTAETETTDTATTLRTRLTAVTARLLTTALPRRKKKYNPPRRRPLRPLKHRNNQELIRRWWRPGIDCGKR
jgi:hypothetical protein